MINDFNLTFGQVAKVWWAYFWRSFLMQTLVFAGYMVCMYSYMYWFPPVAIIESMIANGVDASVLNVVYLYCSLLGMHRALNCRYKGFYFQEYETKGQNERVGLVSISGALLVIGPYWLRCLLYLIVPVVAAFAVLAMFAEAIGIGEPFQIFVIVVGLAAVGVCSTMYALKVTLNVKKMRGRRKHQYGLIYRESRISQK